MKLRDKDYPFKFWYQLHTCTLDPSTLLSVKKKKKPSTKTKIDSCLNSLVPHIQQTIYHGAIDRRKGETRTGRYSLSRAQYTLIETLGTTYKYGPVPELECYLNLQCCFRHKGYFRAVNNLQFRLQQLKSVVMSKQSILLLRMGFQQKSPSLIDRLSISF